MIKSYNDWKNEQTNNMTFEDAYNAGVKSASIHYEEEQVATLEYAHSVMSRTSDINFDIASKICELADEVPNIGERIPLGFADALTKKLSDLKELVKEHKESI